MIARLVVIGLFISAGASAQTNVSGTWTLQSKEYLAGPEYGNALARQLTIKQKADSLIIESVSVGGDGQDVNSRSAVGTDGKPLTGTSASSQRKYVRSLKWDAEKKGLILTTVYYLSDNPSEVDFTRVESWSLSPDGKQLKIHKKSVETRSEPWEAEGVYVKAKK